MQGTCEAANESPVSESTARRNSLCIVASIRNLAHIESAYGTATALTVRHVVCGRARDFCTRESGIMTRSGEQIVVLIDRAVPEDVVKAHAVCSDHRMLETVVAALGDAPVCTSMGPIRAAIGASIPTCDGTPFDPESEASAEMRVGTRKWRTGYARDMEIAGELLGAMERDELCFRYEKVCSATDRESVSYWEALLCRTGNGVPVNAGKWVPALERLGLVSRLDRWVVTAVIDTLRAYPGMSLGCNVSIQSATLGGWWSTVIETLAGEPQVAARLVIELTESAPLTDIDAVADFVRALQQLGCRVALDDIGAGYSFVRSLMELGVDIAKVDGGYLHQARANGAARAHLSALIRLAQTCASHVVIERVEDEEDLHVSQACGAHWVQGYLFEPIFAAGLAQSASEPERD
ncbi:EAL domain-containing protein (putative c-di-GMP-specific phosphodiesterase class I) [Paraburkholderia sp. BL6669N2]|nr:EAL domain-containing protein (putative c-di-GMP-specific phosphodiesterase class I) [Paraburkholderia sp. BL6669N2]